MPLVSTIPLPLPVSVKWAGSEKLSRFRVLRDMKKQKRVVRNPQTAERQFEGEDFCICDHQRKYHRASERECANCDCVIFLSPEGARKFKQQTGMVPAEIDGSDYTERLKKTFRHPA